MLDSSPNLRIGAFVICYLNLLNMVNKLNWDSVPAENVNPSMSRQIVWGDKLMIARIKFKDGFIVPLHSHVHEQVTQVISGKMRFWFGENKEETMLLEPGDVIVIPSNLPHEALMIGEVEEVDTWAPPRQDWLDKTDAYLREK
jgi:quercetin dioxygenase-like cupin family protein